MVVVFSLTKTDLIVVVSYSLCITGARITGANDSNFTGCSKQFNRGKDKNKTRVKRKFPGINTTEKTITVER
jgi:hypothetical protein